MNIPEFWFWSAIVFGIVNLLLLLLVWTIFRFAFHRRFDPHPKLKYFTIDDFPGIDMDAVEFTHPQGHLIQGGFYYDDRITRKNEVIIFSHGIGAGHQAYTHLIMAFVQQGYVVFAYDNTGCALSGGAAIRGIPQAVIDLQTALNYLARTTYQHYRWHLIGHSWGAYAVLRGEKMSFALASITSICPFNEGHQMLIRYLPFLRWLKPWMQFVLWLQFGKWGVLSSASLMKNNKTPMLVISGEFDDDVPLKGNYDRYEKVSKTNQNLTLHLANNRRHNPYLSPQAETYVIDTILKGSQAIEKETNPYKKQQFFDQLDYHIVGELDSKFMTKIFKFIRR
jgi:uncharacterized protein